MALIPWLRHTGPRRTLVAFAVTFLAALAVFSLPRFVWNSVTMARAQSVGGQPPRRQDAQGPVTGQGAQGGAGGER